MPKKINRKEKKVDLKSSQEAKEKLRALEYNEYDQPYFPVEESKPPHY